MTSRGLGPQHHHVCPAQGFDQLGLEGHEHIDEPRAQFTRELQNSLEIDAVMSQASSTFVCLANIVNLFE